MKNIFLYADLEEEVYMNIPPYYTTKIGVVCKLQWKLYRLKQSPRAWFERFSLKMKKYGFQQNNSNHILLFKHKNVKLTTLIIYLDDMIITGDNKKKISKRQEQLSIEFEMKNLGGIKNFLVIKVVNSSQCIFRF